jgi:uncharacterized protein (TIGR00156 family)
MGLVAATSAAPSVAAQFTGPGAAGAEMTAAAQEARPGTYVVLDGRLVSHLREAYDRFEDASGELRVEIGDELRGGRRVSPEDTVRLVGEIDRSREGVTHVRIESLQVGG